MTAATHPTSTPERAPPSRKRRWFAFLGGAVAWFVHLIGIFLVSEFGCVGPLAERQWFDIGVVAWLLLAVSVGPLVLALAATWVGALDARDDLQRADRSSARHYLSRIGWMLSSLFALIIAVQTIPALFYLRGC
jgi:hypothetical protein